MMNLLLTPGAAAARETYRVDDPELSEAFEEVLSQISNGDARMRAFRSVDLSAFISRVVLRGRANDYVVVWRRQTDNTPVIVYLGVL